mmetsp:Transcript_3441/g.9859  ORF Transcript_3441/g.9859 Transcript_3441/m.9859 type:complete len:239 (-) Transcript_3441:1102-1818(-)
MEHAVVHGLSLLRSNPGLSREFLLQSVLMRVRQLQVLCVRKKELLHDCRCRRAWCLQKLTRAGEPAHRNHRVVLNFPKLDQQQPVACFDPNHRGVGDALNLPVHVREEEALPLHQLLLQFLQVGRVPLPTPRLRRSRLLKSQAAQEDLGLPRHGHHHIVQFGVRYVQIVGSRILGCRLFDGGLEAYMERDRVVRGQMLEREMPSKELTQRVPTNAQHLGRHHGFGISSVAPMHPQRRL